MLQQRSRTRRVRQRRIPRNLAAVVDGIAVAIQAAERAEPGQRAAAEYERARVARLVDVLAGDLAARVDVIAHAARAAEARHLPGAVGECGTALGTARIAGHFALAVDAVGDAEYAA